MCSRESSVLIHPEDEETGSVKAFSRVFGIPAASVAQPARNPAVTGERQGWELESQMPHLHFSISDEATPSKFDTRLLTQSKHSQGTLELSNEWRWSLILIHSTGSMMEVWAAS